MPRIERILCPTDFSECSAKAYDYAHSLARHYGAKLFVQHVTEQFVAPYHGYIPQNQIEELNAYESAEAQKKFRELAASAKNGLDQEFVFQRWGPAADFILSFAEEQRIDLIVMGTHGRRGLDRLIIGSVLERVLRKARSPILAVRSPHPDVPKSKEHDVDIRRILFCTDFSEDSPRALEYALSLAMQYHAELSLLHVVESIRNDEEFEQQKENALASLQAGMPSEASDWAAVIPVVRAGKAYQEIIQYAEEAESDLIIMGVRGRNAVDLALFGSTTQRVVQLGPCPVLVVRT
jgi:nucleotide-binding universal stress UspA family protein